MNYVPTEITQANLHWAINKNIQDIERVLRTKQTVVASKPMPKLDAKFNVIRGVVSEEDTDACTLEKFTELRNA